MHLLPQLGGANLLREPGIRSPVAKLDEIMVARHRDCAGARLTCWPSTMGSVAEAWASLIMTIASPHRRTHSRRVFTWAIPRDLEDVVGQDLRRGTLRCDASNRSFAMLTT